MLRSPHSRGATNGRGNITQRSTGWRRRDPNSPTPIALPRCAHVARHHMSTLDAPSDDSRDCDRDTGWDAVRCPPYRALKQFRLPRRSHDNLSHR